MEITEEKQILPLDQEEVVNKLSIEIIPKGNTPI